MKTLLALALLMPAAMSGQGTNFDCVHVFTFTAIGTQLVQNTSTTTPCRAWGVSYTTTGFTTVTLSFGTSPDSAPGDYVAVPNTACTSTTPPAPPCVTSGASPIAAGKTGTGTYIAFDRFYGVNVSSVTGSGTITITVYGYKALGAGSASTGSGGSGGGATTNQNLRDVKQLFDGGGAALSGSATRCQEVSFGGTITGAFIEADQTGNITIDVQTVAHSSYTGPGSASSIVGVGTKPNLSSTVVYTDTTLTSWTTSLTAGAAVCFAMSAPATITWATITIRIAAN